MFPGIYEFAWDTGHIVFLGIFYCVIAVVFITIARAMVGAIRDLRTRRHEAVRWHADFEDLPSKWRRCRHELAGEVDHRVCENAFDCRHCADHPRFLAAQAAAEAEGAGTRISASGTLADQLVAGFRLPADRLYHRGHTWVREEPDGTLAIGLDDLASRLLGVPDSLELPPVGSHLMTNGSGWEARKGNVRVRVLAPVDGEVAEVGGPSSDWILKIKPDERGADTRHLLTPREARGWMMREVERVQLALAPDSVGATLADGGLPIEDFSVVIPPETLDELCAVVFLEP